jgi:HPt (histidine-containing phosphotransfer) domain-containing protein
MAMELHTYPDGKIVNIEYLKQLSRGNNQFVEDMIRIFLTENPEEIKLLEKAILEKNYEVIKATTHKLKATLPYLGLEKVVEHEVAEAESLAASRGDIDRIGTLFQKIKEICERACNELRHAA